jgi:hypothetical protein
MRIKLFYTEKSDPKKLYQGAIRIPSYWHPWIEWQEGINIEPEFKSIVDVLKFITAQGEIDPDWTYYICQLTDNDLVFLLW